MRHRKIRKIFGILLVVMIAMTGLGLAAWQLWNWLMPVIFGLPRIGFWQAMGLMGLSWIFFGGLRGIGPRGRRCRSFRREPYTDFSPEGLTEKERDRFRRKFAGRCGERGPTTEPA
jgi:hypothetical protein